MTKHLDGKRPTLCSLLSIKHIGGRPSSAPKLILDTEHISRALRALQRCFLCDGRQPPRLLSSASERDMETTAWSGTNMCAVAGCMTVVVMICCMLVGLLVPCRKSRWVAETTSRSTPTLYEDLERCHVFQTAKITIYGEAVHCRQSIPSEVTPDANSELVFSLRSNRQPTFGQCAVEAAPLDVRTIFETQGASNV